MEAVQDAVQELRAFWMGLGVVLAARDRRGREWCAQLAVSASWAVVAASEGLADLCL